MARRNRRSSLSTLSKSAETAGAEAPSKTARKKQAQALQDLGLALTQLPTEQRRAVDMPEDLREAIEDYVNTRSHGARRRQLQFVGKLLRQVDAAPLLAALERLESGGRADAERLHTIERWRDALINDDEALTRWLAEHPDSDVQRLRRLIRAARSEGAGQDAEQRQPKSARQLFRFIRQKLEASSGE